MTESGGGWLSGSRQGVRNEYFTLMARSGWMLNGCYQAIIIYFGVTWSFHLNSDRPDGRLQVCPCPPLQTQC